jgi:hypothetical protein
VTRPGDARLRQVFDTVEPLIERRWGIPVVIRDVPHPFTGDLDGAEIHVDHDLEIDEALFVVAHLFGHTVQWNTAPETRDIGRVRPGAVTDAELAAVRRYELDACRYSLQLFHEAGVRDLDGWLADFATCDLAYLEHYYRTGEKRPFRSFWRDDQPRLEPLGIPAFHPSRWMSRWEGTVV